MPLGSVVCPGAPRCVWEREGERVASSQESSWQEEDRGTPGPGGLCVETQLYTLFYERPRIRPGGACASCTITAEERLGSPGPESVGEMEGARGGRRGKQRQAGARSPSEKSANVLRARGKQARAFVGAHPLSHTHARSPPLHTGNPLARSW